MHGSLLGFHLSSVCVSVSVAPLLSSSTVAQPIRNACGIADPLLYHEMRRRFYLPPNTLPMFSPGWVLRRQRPLSDAEMARFPSNWVVVLAARHGTRRLVNEGTIQTEMVRLFGKERVVYFDGALHLPEGVKPIGLLKSSNALVKEVMSVYCSG